MHALAPATTFDTTLIGQVDRPAVAVVGVWDPLTAVHERLFEELVSHARARRQAAVAVLLDPPPTQFLPTSGAWALYEPTAIRIERLKALGVDGVIVVAFTARHLATSAADFVDSLRARIALAELWLGATQRFGRGESGSQEAVFAHGAEQGYAVRRLPPEGAPRGEGYAVRMRLRSGCVAAARTVVGRPPLLSRALAGPVELGWPSGRYRAWPLESLAGKAGGALLPLDVRASGDGHCVLDWPDSAPPYLAVALGPHDLPDARLADA